MEKFKIINYKDVYIEVGNKGTILIDKEKVNIRKSPDGYLVFTLKTKYGYTTARVHRLVAIAFVPNDNPEIKTEVNHIDFNRENPNSDNLEWVTHEDNVKYSVKNGRYNNRNKRFIGEGNPNYGNKTLSQKYKENPLLAKEKQSRKGARNGMCKRVQLYNNGELEKEFEFIGDLCEYLINKESLKTSVNNLRAYMRECYKNNKMYKGIYTIKYI